MKNIQIVWLVMLLILMACEGGGLPDPVEIENKDENKETLENLGELFKDDFLIGTSLNSKLDATNEIWGNLFINRGGKLIHKDEESDALVLKHFNTIVSGNILKPQPIQPSEGNFNFEKADQFVEYGEANDMWITGHVLVWHSQVGDWMFKDAAGKEISRQGLLDRMNTHINTLVGRYKGRIDGWDVVNEAIDNGQMRASKWYNIIGEEFVDSAFSYAHKADPNAELYYNDYSLDNEVKRNATVKLIKRLKANDIRIDAVGMQGHYGLSTDIAEVEKSIVAFYNEGVKVMITELDISVLPTPPWHTIGDAEIGVNAEYDAKYDPYKDALPLDVELEQAYKYRDLFAMFLKHKEKISRVTFWGLTDRDNWKSSHPIKGRTDYALIFDRDNEPKLAFDEIIRLKK